MLLFVCKSHLGSFLRLGIDIIAGWYIMYESEVGKSCSTHARMINAYKVLDGKPEGSRPLGRPKCGWTGDIKIDFKDIIWEGLTWVCLA
jgi:hypothetical protein